MAAIIDTVRAGDVISSDLINRMIDLLNEHSVLLEGGGGSGGTGTGTIITGFSPLAQQNVGKNLTVFGNFDFPLATNALSIGGVTIPTAAFLPGSNNLQIVFKIPSAIVVAQNTTKPVTVKIVNSKGTDERPYTLLPEVAALPDPVISDVRDTGNNSTTLRSEKEARITGQNFAAPAASNAIVFTLNPGPGQKNFSLTAKAGSVINPSPQNSTILVDMPHLVDADGVALGDSAPGTLTLTVTGANSPATVATSIERTA
jgi:hypothetical protein